MENAKKRNTYSVDEDLETPFRLKNFLRCGPYIKRNLKLLIGALIFSISATLLGLLGPTFTQVIIDRMIPEKSIRGVIIVAILYFLSAFSTAVKTSAIQSVFTDSICPLS